ncbi:hypothetical protein HN51_034899 [Arachis hypogaea]
MIGKHLPKQVGSATSRSETYTDQISRSTFQSWRTKWDTTTNVLHNSMKKHINGGRISYLEKHLASAAETFTTLRSFEGQYSLVIVGKEGGVNSILTKGMDDWQQYPVLEAIGDVLSGPDFTMTVSVFGNPTT